MDTSAWIYFLNRVAPYYDVVAAALREMQVGRRHIVVSVVTEMELLIRPLREGRRSEIELIESMLADAPSLSVVDLDRATTRLAAGLRARYGLKVADAAIVATAIASECDAVLGNDELCAKRVKEIPYVYLEDCVRKKTPQSDG